MSLITFRDKNTSGDPVGPTWYLNFDALTVEELSRSAEVTQYPVESGAVLSDHYQPLPREIRLSGVVSETPTEKWSNLEGMQDAAKSVSMVVRPLRLQIKPSVDKIGPAGALRPISTSFLPGRRVIQSNVERARLYIPKFAMTLQTADGSADIDATTNQFSAARSTTTRIASFTSILDGLMQSRTSVSVILQTGAEYANMFITDMRAPRVAGSSGSISFSVDMVEVTVAEPVKETGTAQQRQEPTHKPKKATGKKGTKSPDDIQAARLRKLLRQGNLQAPGTQ
jgi:hypothetical protein